MKIENENRKCFFKPNIHFSIHFNANLNGCPLLRVWKFSHDHAWRGMTSLSNPSYYTFNKIFQIMEWISFASYLTSPSQTFPMKDGINVFSVLLILYLNFSWCIVVFELNLRLFVTFQSHSSVLTDDEGTSAHSNKNGIEKLRSVYAQKKVEVLQLGKGHCQFDEFYF